MHDVRRATGTGLLGYLPKRGSIDFAIAVRELMVMGPSATTAC